LNSFSHFIGKSSFVIVVLVLNIHAEVQNANLYEYVMKKTFSHTHPHPRMFMFSELHCMEAIRQWYKTAKVSKQAIFFVKTHLRAA